MISPLVPPANPPETSDDKAAFVLASKDPVLVTPNPKRVGSWEVSISGLVLAGHDTEKEAKDTAARITAWISAVNAPVAAPGTVASAGTVSNPGTAGTAVT